MRKLLLAAGTLFFVLTALAFAGGQTEKSTNSNSSNAQATSRSTPDIEVWYTNNGYTTPITKGSPRYEFLKNELGVGVTQPYISWNGGADYLNALNTRFASGNIPNVFQPWNGNEAQLAKEGAIVNLRDLLPKYAPKMWNLVPQSVWKVVEAADPNGKGGIYWIPRVSNYWKEGALIRQDWLDKLGLNMPKTTAELVKVLTAFKNDDPNGNGIKDEIPTSGRQGATWMNPLFEPFGVAMVEGNPQWDIYDGKLTYAGVTRNARDALSFIAQLYKQGLLDQEFALNSKSQWEGKINASKVGLYFHWAQTTSLRHLIPIYQASGVKADFNLMPPVAAPDYQGKEFITATHIDLPEFVVSAKQDRAHLLASLKFLNESADTSKWDALYWGIQSMDYKTLDGQKQFLPENFSTQQNPYSPAKFWGTLDFTIQLLKESETADTKWAVEQDIRDVKAIQNYTHFIAGDGMPADVYRDYPDIKNDTLWKEYATKIILGQYPISKFDEFVQKWNESGGAEVTKRARAWYANVEAQN